MPRYVAFLRGVSPSNLKMPDLKKCFEKAGFTNIVTVLSSGNVVFDSSKKSEKALERDIEQAMEKNLKKVFPTIVRSQTDIVELLKLDPYKKIKIPSSTKKVMTFLKNQPEEIPNLPIKKDDVNIFLIEDRVVYSTYLPHPKGPVFMSLLQKTFGQSITTRTWDTVEKLSKK